jgi:hypothetical protein
VAESCFSTRREGRFVAESCISTHREAGFVSDRRFWPRIKAPRRLRGATSRRLFVLFYFYICRAFVTSKTELCIRNNY